MQLQFPLYGHPFIFFFLTPSFPITDFDWLKYWFRFFISVNIRLDWLILVQISYCWSGSVNIGLHGFDVKGISQYQLGLLIFLILNFFFYTLMTFLTMLLVILLSMLMILLFTVQVSDLWQQLELASEIESDL